MTYQPDILFEGIRDFDNCFNQATEEASVDNQFLLEPSQVLYPSSSFDQGNDPTFDDTPEIGSPEPIIDIYPVPKPEYNGVTWPSGGSDSDKPSAPTEEVSTASRPTMTDEALKEIIKKTKTNQSAFNRKGQLKRVEYPKSRTEKSMPLRSKFLKANKEMNERIGLIGKGKLTVAKRRIVLNAIQSQKTRLVNELQTELLKAQIEHYERELKKLSRAVMIDALIAPAFDQIEDSACLNSNAGLCGAVEFDTDQFLAQYQAKLNFFKIEVGDDHEVRLSKTWTKKSMNILFPEPHEENEEADQPLKKRAKKAAAKAGAQARPASKEDVEEDDQELLPRKSRKV